jgi:hypothetical protein
LWNVCGRRMAGRWLIYGQNSAAHIFGIYIQRKYYTNTSKIWTRRMTSALMIQFREECATATANLPIRHSSQRRTDQEVAKVWLPHVRALSQYIFWNAPLRPNGRKHQLVKSCAMNNDSIAFTQTTTIKAHTEKSWAAKCDSVHTRRRLMLKNMCSVLLFHLHMRSPRA